MAKKENLVKVLQAGKVKVQKDVFTDGIDLVKVTTATGSYQFPSEGKNGWNEIEASMKSFDRQMANRLNYGTRNGRADLWKDNTTGKQLGLLAGRPEYISTAWRAWQMAQKAPKKLQRYVYHNLIVWANREHADAAHFMLKEIDAYTFDVLPAAWRKHLDMPVPELENTSVDFQLEDLAPSSMYQIGQEIAHEQRGYSKKRVRASWWATTMCIAIRCVAVIRLLILTSWSIAAKELTTKGRDHTSSQCATTRHCRLSVPTRIKTGINRYKSV